MAKNLLKELDVWHKTKRGMLTAGVIELIIAYILGIRAIDTGSLWQYLFTLIFFVGGLYNIFKLIGNIINAGRKSKKA
jgi:hypothetical protein